MPVPRGHKSRCLAIKVGSLQVRLGVAEKHQNVHVAIGSGRERGCSSILLKNKKKNIGVMSFVLCDEFLLLIKCERDLGLAVDIRVGRKKSLHALDVVDS